MYKENPYFEFFFFFFKLKLFPDNYFDLYKPNSVKYINKRVSWKACIIHFNESLYFEKGLTVNCKIAQRRYT